MNKAKGTPFARLSPALQPIEIKRAGTAQKGLAKCGMPLIGYDRVSTDDQNLAMQLDPLQATGCADVFQDQGISGAVTKRPGLTAALDRCGPGDVLTAWKLDRLGRSVLDLVGLAERLKDRGVGLKILTGQGAMIDTTRPDGKFAFAMFAAFAEFEREMNRERTTEGMKAAKRRAIHVGRPRKLSADQVAHARQLIEAGNRTYAGAAALLGVDVSTLRRALKRS